MPRDARFWRNIAVVAAAHAMLAATVVAWSRATRTPEKQSIIWMSNELLKVASKNSAVRTESIAEKTRPPPELNRSNPQPREPAVTPAARSDIQLPVATPSPAPIKTPAPKPNATPPAKALVKKQATPSAKAAPKKSAAKIAPASSPKNPGKVSEQEKASNEKEKATGTIGPSPASGVDGNKSAITGSGGGARSSEFAWYGKMLHDRFYSEWVQPTTSVPAGARMSALVRIRIDSDGRISKFNIIRPSGNVVVDESVAEVAKRVKRVDPLPSGLSDNSFHEVNINFELNPTE